VLTVVAPCTIRPLPNLPLKAKTLSSILVHGYSFRRYHYVTVPVALSAAGTIHDVCADTGATASLIDRKFLLAEHPDAAITQVPTPMTVTGIGNRKHDASHYAKVPMFIKGLDSEGEPRTAMIEREYHIVDNLTAKALIGIDVIKPESMDILLTENTVRIGSCGNLKVPVKVHKCGPRVTA